jgi:hypothetical protein
MPEKKAFLSSTGKDLAEYREAAYHAIEGLDGWHCVRMEDFGARDWDADEFCRARVAECDVLVGIVGHLYGTVPKGKKESYTEREYEAAKNAGNARLMFVAPEDFPLPANLREPKTKWSKQRAFRERVSSEQIKDTFTSPDDLARRVIQAIRNWEQEHAAERPTQGAPNATGKAKPNVVFDGFEYVRDQLVQPANISEDALSEFACVRFVNEPEVKGPGTTVPDLHAHIEISQGEKNILAVADGRWAENVDREQAPGRETKSIPLPSNGETRTLNIVMQRRGQDECYGWSHGGRKIPDPPIPKGSHAVRVELDGSNMEARTFRFELRNNGREDFLELREAPGSTIPCSARWASKRSALAIECRTESGLRLGDERMALAYLVVRCVNQGQIQNAYVKVNRILEHTFQSINRESRPYTQRLYEHEDIFLKWQATEERYHSFHSEAVLNVARGRSGDGGYGLVSHTSNLFPRLQIWDWYEITLDIAADNSPLLQRTLILRMEEPIAEIADKRVLIPGAPYHVEFREKEPGETMPPPNPGTAGSPS